MQIKYVRRGVVLIFAIIITACVIIRINVVHCKVIDINDISYTPSEGEIIVNIEDISLDKTMDISVNDSGYFGYNVNYYRIVGWAAKADTDTTVFNMAVLLKKDDTHFYKLRTEMVKREDLVKGEERDFSWENGGFKSEIAAAKLKNNVYPIYLLYEDGEVTYLVDTGKNLEVEQ